MCFRCHDLLSRLHYNLTAKWKKNISKRDLKVIQQIMADIGDLQSQIEFLNRFQAIPLSTKSLMINSTTLNQLELARIKDVQTRRISLLVHEEWI